jgi:thermitase
MKQVRNAVWGDVIRRNKITGQQVRVPDMSQLYTFIFEEPVPLDSTVNEFLKLPEVEFAHQPVSVVYHGNPPGDLHYPNQWNLQVIDAVNAWNITQGLSTIKVGILDTGVHEAHEDLQSKFDTGDGDGTAKDAHGTAVAGIAAAATDNQGKGIASLGWNVNLVSYLNGDNESTAGAHTTAENIIDAGNRTDVHVINMSFGTLRKDLGTEDLPGGCSPFPPPGTIDKLSMPEDYTEIRQAISAAIAQGTICVATAGNSSVNEEYLSSYPGCDPMEIPFPNYPAFYPGVIAVSATEMVNTTEQFRDGWNYSNTSTGDSVDVAAPGTNIWVTTESGGYDFRSRAVHHWPHRLSAPLRP